MQELQTTMNRLMMFNKTESDAGVRDDDEHRLMLFNKTESDAGVTDDDEQTNDV